MQRNKKTLFFVIVVGFLIVASLIRFIVREPEKPMKNQEKNYWFLLHRKSNTEALFQGVMGDKQQSTLLKTFIVKTGRPGERPTPLPQLLGKEYWVVIKKEEQLENEETAPYFLTLNIPAPIDEPYGPVPYEECNGQCHWVLPGAFGLHGTAGKPERLTKEDPGSSGCIRHSDEDITYLYHLLDPSSEEIRYYVEDN